MEEYDEAKSTEEFQTKEFIRNNGDEDASDCENFDVITMNVNNAVAQKLQEENGFSNNIDYEQHEILSLQCVFKQIYQKRIKGIDNFPGLDNSEKNEEKLQILRTYVEQLEEQNEVLVSTMMELEKEAQQRVVQMERRLKSSAKSTMEAVLNLHECEQEMRRLVTERLHIEAVLDSIQHQVSTLKVENNFLRDQNFNLNHDIQALLHIIQHARTSGHWEMDCVTFCEVTPEQVFGPVQSMSQIHSHESVGSNCHVKGVLDDSKLKESSRQSSQRTSHSSTPSLGHQSAVAQMHDELNHLQFLQGEAHHELLEKNKTIASLEAQLSEVKHQLTLKEAECQCHLWEIETLRQQSKCLRCKKSEDIVGLDDMLSEMQPVCDTMLKKSSSLPNLGNFVHRGNLMQRSLSYRTDLVIPQRRAVCMLKTEYLDLLRERRNRIKQQIERQPCRPVMLKSEFGTYFRRVYSEPLFFMYGDNIYVYRPCEPIQTEPSLALHSLHEDYRHGLAPCQSIDLKLPTEETSGPSLRVCEWDLIRGPQEFAMPEDSTVMPCHRVQISNSSSTSSDSEDMQCLPDISCRMQESTGLGSGAYVLQQCSRPLHHSHLQERNSTSSLHWCENEASHESDIFHNHSCVKSLSYRKNVMTSSCFVQTEEIKHPFSLSIGLQADLPKEYSSENIDISTANGHNGMDIGDIKRNLKMLKENLQRAEDKASSKEILIEQLQNHLHMAVKEVELKDTALENVERKLDLSRHESMTLKKQITNLESEIQQLLGDLEDARMIHDNLSLNVEARKEQIEEFRQQEQVLQDQKRSLMIQLDAQGDELEQTKKDLDRVKVELKECTVQIEQQTVIIQTLQEAVVQSKRAFDEVKQTTNHKPAVVPSSVLYTQNKSTQPPKCSVVDI